MTEIISILTSTVKKFSCWDENRRSSPESTEKCQDGRYPLEQSPNFEAADVKGRCRLADETPVCETVHCINRIH